MPPQMTPEEKTETKQLLCAARELFLAQQWCQGMRALTAAGDETTPSSPDAVRFCTVGALRFAARATESNVLPAVHMLYEALVRQHSWNPAFPWDEQHLPFKVERLEEWNDGVAQGVDDVLSLYGQAIDLLEGH